MMMISKFIIIVVVLTFLWTTTGDQSSAATTASAIINSSSSSSSATTTIAAFVGFVGNGRSGRCLQEATIAKRLLWVRKQQQPRFAKLKPVVSRNSCFYNIQRHHNNNNIMKLNFSKQRDGDEDTSNDNASKSSSSVVVEVVGLSAQPIVWLSLYFVATTGAGLPSGPGGLIGALEGISYVIVLYFGLIKGVIFHGNNGVASGTTEKKLRSVETLSIATLLLGLLILIRLIADQGCIPNAKPILDYSNYVKVCNDID